MGWYPRIKSAFLMFLNSTANISTASQPKSIAVVPDTTIFVAEISGVEAIRDNQKISELKTSYEPSAVAAISSFVAVGEVSNITLFEISTQFRGMVGWQSPHT